MDTPLTLAVAEGHVDCVQVLIEEEADLNLPRRVKNRNFTVAFFTGIFLFFPRKEK